MKFLIAAVALTIAVPAAAQHGGHAQPAAHDQHKGMDHGKEHKDCCDHKNKDGTPMKCCKEMAAGKKADCCEKEKSGS